MLYNIPEMSAPPFSRTIMYYSLVAWKCFCYKSVIWTRYTLSVQWGGRLRRHTGCRLRLYGPDVFDRNLQLNIIRFLQQSRRWAIRLFNGRMGPVNKSRMIPDKWVILPSSKIICPFWIRRLYGSSCPIQKFVEVSFLEYKFPPTTPRW